MKPYKLSTVSSVFAVRCFFDKVPQQSIKKMCTVNGFPWKLCLEGTICKTFFMRGYVFSKFLKYDSACKTRTWTYTDGDRISCLPICCLSEKISFNTAFILDAYIILQKAKTTRVKIVSALMLTISCVLFLLDESLQLFVEVCSKSHTRLLRNLSTFFLGEFLKLLHI